MVHILAGLGTFKGLDVGVVPPYYLYKTSSQNRLWEIIIFIT